MDIKESQINGFTVLAIEGDVDLNSSPKVREVVAGIIDKGAGHIIINFEKVPYVDSSGLATFIEVMQRLKKNSGDLYLVGMSEKIKGLFEITKLDKLFKIYKMQEEVPALS